MPSDVQVHAPALEQPPAEAVTKPEELKPVNKKERKTRVPKDQQPKPPKTASHPTYFQMIKESLLALNEKGGSSPYAIGKYVEEKHKAVLPANFRKMLALQLKNSAAKGKLIKIRASYKLSEVGKKVKGSATKVGKKATVATKQQQQPKEKKKTASKKVSALIAKAEKRPDTTKAKKPGAMKTRKSTPAKPKQPKSIRSPATKRARKATV